MTKLEELKAAYEAATPGEWWYAAANETEYECGVGDFPISVPTTKATARYIALAHNNMAALLEAVERLEAMQRVIGELASMNPFLRDVFDTNKAVLEKLK